MNSIFKKMPVSGKSTRVYENNDVKTTPFFQPKLTVNQPGDAYEQEADRVADQVMRMRDGEAPVVQHKGITPVGNVQRKKEKKTTPEVQSDAVVHLSSGYSYKDTPYGRVLFYTHDQAAQLPVIDKIVKAADEETALYTKLLGLVPKLGIARKNAAVWTALPTVNRYDDYTKIPGQKVSRVSMYKPIGPEAGTPTRDVKADITTNASSKAVSYAETAETSKNALITVKILLEDFQSRLQSARTELRLALRMLDAAKKRDAAAELRKKGERQEEAINTALSLLGSAIEMTVDVSQGGALGAIKPAYDMLTTVIKIFRENDLSAQAETLETEARAIDMQNAADKLSLVKDVLKHVDGMLEKVKDVSRDVEADYFRQRGRAENEFDLSSKGQFKSKDVSGMITLADQVWDLCLEMVRGPRHQLGTLQFQAMRLNENRVGVAQIYDKIRSGGITTLAFDVNRISDARSEHAFEIRTEADALRIGLHSLRRTAHEALVNAPGK